MAHILFFAFAVKQSQIDVIEVFNLAAAFFHRGKLRAAKRHPTSFDALDELLNRQHYRLCYWHVASDEINYRRFFDVNVLAALSTLPCSSCLGDPRHAISK